jgi:hypothetical protein
MDGFVVFVVMMHGKKDLNGHKISSRLQITSVLNSYPSCSCPIDERYVAGACQASKYIHLNFLLKNKKLFYSENNQCAPGRILCQNGLNCAESARQCEQDHTQYTEAFKNTARCTLDKPNDGFDCYYTGHGINNTCIPFEWLCDGVYDCAFGNDEEHCHKMTTTRKPTKPTSNRCLTDKKCKLMKPKK